MPVVIIILDVPSLSRGDCGAMVKVKCSIAHDPSDTSERDNVEELTNIPTQFTGTTEVDILEKILLQSILHSLKVLKVFDYKGDNGFETVTQLDESFASLFQKALCTRL